MGPTSEIAKATATVGNVYGVAQIGTLSSSSDLSNTFNYPYFSRMTASPKGYTQTVKSALLYYQSIQGAGWTDVAVISTITEFANNIANTFIEISSPEITILAYQQFLREDIDTPLEVEFTELQKSGARVFYAPIFDNWHRFIELADSYGLIGDNYVWIAPPAEAAKSFEPDSRLQGCLGVVVERRGPESPQVQQFVDLWNQLDSAVYPGTEYPVSTPFVYIGYDLAITAAMAMDTLERRGELQEPISPELWNEVIRAVQFEGVSNSVSFESNGDRIGNFNLQYYSVEKSNWETVAVWTEADGYTPTGEVVWHSNSTKIPDLNIREPFHYWSCHSKERKLDETGKTVSRHTPGRSDVDDIDSGYHCDYFIDCKNMSDESVDCPSDYLIVFIIFGIITGILVLLCLVLIVFVLVYGLFFKYRRLRSAAPVFLILILVSEVVGYISIYAWFGKPHPVACALQPWLLGLSAISMVAGLFVKNFRIWRIFKFPMKTMRITDLELFFLWIIVMIPAILILTLWAIVSTPTAKLKDYDGTEHYTCETGGFTGPPGGIIFFFIFVGYTAIVLLVSAVMSVLIRKVPSQFNESQVITISIYNLIFLGCVIIPVYLVVYPYNPFIAWILRTCAILYAFTATLILLFGPMVFGVFILAKGKNVRTFKSNLKGPNTSPTSNSAKKY